MKRASWHIPARGTYRRAPERPKVLLKRLPASDDYLAAFDDLRLWKQAVRHVASPPALSRKPIDTTLIRQTEELLRTLDEEERRRWASLRVKKRAADRELRTIMGFDLDQVQRARRFAATVTPNIVGCGAVLEQWSATAAKSWHVGAQPSANADTSDFEVFLYRVGVVIQNHYYVPIFLDDDDVRWTCLAVDATTTLSGLADVPPGGSVFIRATHAMIHYRNQPWRAGRPGVWFRPPQEGSPIHRYFCKSSDVSDSGTGLHVIPPFAVNVSFVSHDIRPGDFFEYIQFVNVIAYGSVADLTGVGGIRCGNPYFRLFGA